MINNYTGLNTYRQFNPVKNNNKVAFKSSCRESFDTPLVIHADVTEKSVNEIFGSRIQGYTSVFDKALFFLSCEYAKELGQGKIKREEMTQKLTRAAVNSEKIMSEWDKQLRTGVRFKREAGKFADSRAEEVYKKHADAHNIMDAKGKMLVKIEELGDDFTKRKLYEMLTLDYAEVTKAENKPTSTDGDQEFKFSTKRVMPFDHTLHEIVKTSRPKWDEKTGQYTGSEISLNEASEIIIKNSVDFGLTPGSLLPEYLAGNGAIDPNGIPSNLGLLN